MLSYTRMPDNILVQAITESLEDQDPLPEVEVTPRTSFPSTSSGLTPEERSERARRGGKARAAGLHPKQRQKIARSAANTRYRKAQLLRHGDRLLAKKIQAEAARLEKVHSTRRR